MNRAAVKAEATVVSSLTTTCCGGLLPSNGEKNDRRIVATRFAGLRHAAGSHEVEHAVAMRTVGANLEAAIVARLRLVELFGCAGAGFPQGYGGLRDGRTSAQPPAP